jgi:hypothetical protein
MVLKRLLCILVVLLASTLCTMAQTGGKKYCSIQGAVYFTENRNLAEFFVYEVEQADFADLIVFKEDQRLFADAAGLWFIVEHISMADYVVFKEKTRPAADFAISYTDTRSFAGCR